jgi:hypothetical protein
MVSISYMAIIISNILRCLPQHVYNFSTKILQHAATLCFGSSITKVPFETFQDNVLVFLTYTRLEMLLGTLDKNCLNIEWITSVLKVVFFECYSRCPKS